MSATIDGTMRRSAIYFRSYVWPRFAGRLGGGDLIPVESVTDSYFAQLLDTQAGIDAWQLVGDGGIRGIASRVQIGTLWESWTVRFRLPSGRPTEYDKLVTADTTLLRPGYHIQAYTRSLTEPPLGAAAIRTSDLTRLLLASSERKRNPVDGNVFVPIWWTDAMDAGYEVWLA